jgi:hypothetical protein
VGQRYAPVPKRTAPIAPSDTNQPAAAAALQATTSTTAAPGLQDAGTLPVGVQPAAEVATEAEAAALAATVGAATGSANVTGAVQAPEAPIAPARLAQPPVAPAPAALPTPDDAGLFDGGGKPRVTPLEFLKLNNIEPTELNILNITCDITGAAWVTGGVAGTFAGCLLGTGITGDTGAYHLVVVTSSLGIRGPVAAAKVRTELLQHTRMGAGDIGEVKALGDSPVVGIRLAGARMLTNAISLRHTHCGELMLLPSARHETGVTAAQLRKQSAITLSGMERETAESVLLHIARLQHSFPQLAKQDIMVRSVREVEGLREVTIAASSEASLRAWLACEDQIKLATGWAVARATGGAAADASVAAGEHIMSYTGMKQMAQDGNRGEREEFVKVVVVHLKTLGYTAMYRKELGGGAGQVWACGGALGHRIAELITVGPKAFALNLNLVAESGDGSSITADFVVEVNGKPYNVNVKPSARNTKNTERPVTYLAAAAAHAETREMIVTTVTQVAAHTAQVQQDTFTGLVEKMTEAAQENARQSAETQRLLVANLEMQQQNHQTVTHGVNNLMSFGERQALGIEALVRVMTSAHQQQTALPPPPALLLAPQAAAPQAHAPGAAAAALLLYQQYQAALAAIPQVP